MSLIENLKTFLTPEQIKLFEANHLTTPSSFRFVTLAELRAKPFCLPIGLASRVLDAANPSPAAVTSQPPTVVHIAPQQSQEERTGPALEAAAKDPSRVKALLDLSVKHVVLAADDRVDPSSSAQLIAHLASGGRLPTTWRGQKIADVRRLSTPPIWCSPRPPHRELQAGADEVSRVMWAALGVDGLRVACHGYARGFFEGMTEPAVFNLLAVPPVGFSGARHKDISDDFDNSGFARTHYDHLLFPQPRSTSRDDPPHEDPVPPVTGQIVRDLSSLLLNIFGSDDLRRVLRDLPDGAKIVNALPGGNAAPLVVADAATRILISWGYTSNENAREILITNLVQERPRREAEIRRVFR